MAGNCLESGDILLGIETSCDETAAAVVAEGHTILSSVVASQDDLHVHFGGVVPEVASRRHSETVTAVVGEALDRAGPTWGDLLGIAVTHGPGLVGSLLVGVTAAKGYALATGLPLIGVNHIEGHLLAGFLRGAEGGEAPAGDLFPTVCLVASGGHSDIFLVEALGEYRILGWTRDDAAGEAFEHSSRARERRGAAQGPIQQAEGDPTQDADAGPHDQGGPTF